MIITNTGRTFLLCQEFTTDTGLLVLCGIENGRWHLSVSHPTRLPTWEEVKQLRYELMPKDKNMAMILPPEKDYVNIHEFCFHLFEIDFEGGF
jgi:hypothetical protein